MISHTLSSSKNRLRAFFTQDITELYGLKEIFIDDTNLTLIEMDYTDEIYRAIINYLSQVEAVTMIMLIREENTLHIWSVLSRYDKTTREAVYEKERQIIDCLFKTDLHFNFYLAEPKEINEILSSGAVIIYSK